jgi:hypothetical protein
MAHYASRHGYGFDCYKDYSLPVNLLPMDVPNRIYWTGVAGALAKLRSGHYDRVIWLDCDQMITNPEFEIGLPGFGFRVSQDWGADAVEPWHFSACGFIAHKDCIEFLEAVLQSEPEWRERPFPEQAPLRNNAMIRMKNAISPTIHVHPRRYFNAVPKEIDPTVQEPWQPGDFAAHLTNLPLEKRIELFHEIKRQAGI